MIIGIYTNLKRDYLGKNALALSKYLISIGIEVLSVYNKNDGFLFEGEPFEIVASKADVMVVFGGDGTMISLARECAKFDLPVMGINSGNLGFLTECTVQDMFISMDRVVKSDFFIDKRSMLEVEVDGFRHLAVNEITLSRGDSHHTIDINIFIDGKMADMVKGDGVIVSTPTGSTAYSLSCGGPILSPDVEGFAVSAICPHSLHSRPMVISDKSIVRLEFKNSNVMVVVDGESINIDNNVVIIKKSDISASFLRLKDENFYSKLLNKLYYWNDNKKRESDR